MNSETFYKEIGNIDDDLIQAASEAHGHKRGKTVFYGIAGIAACLCLICGVLFFGANKDSVYINSAAAPMTNAKVIAPSNEDTETVVMTYQELLSYYGIEQLPDNMAELEITKQSFFVIYRDQAGNILSDTNILYYNSSEGSKSLSVTLAKADKLPEISGEDIKYSKLDGGSVILASTDRVEYWAGFKLNGVSVNITSRGVSEEDFINAVRVIIGLLK